MNFNHPTLYFIKRSRSIIKASAATARRHSRIKSWKPLTINELKKLLAIVFNMGLLKKNINRGVLEYYNAKIKVG
jgi:hypothetical protein